MKKVLTVILILIGLVTVVSFTYLNISRPEAEAGPFIKTNAKHNSYRPETSKEKLCNDIIVSFLFVHTQKAVEDFYSKYLKEIPGADPNFDKVLSIERIGDENRLDFIIKVETMPYIGPHNTVGRDHITFRLNALGEVTLEKLDHIESNKILPQLYPDIIKKWPPQ